MKFTIAIATYNRLPLLKRAIDSALAQTLSCEVVVVDDASTDGTEQYVRSLSEALRAAGDPRLVYCRNEENCGHALTVNKGVEVASGDWVKLLDDDDYLAFNCIEEMTRAIALHPAAAICSCRASQVDENECELSRTREVGPGRAFYIPQEDIHYGMLLELVPFGTPAQVAFRRDAFLETGGWDSSLDTNCDDIDSWIRIAEHGDAIFINQCLAFRRVWAEAYNKKFTIHKRLETNILMKQKICDRISEKHRDRVPAFQNITAYLKLHWLFVALKSKQLPTALKLAFPSIFRYRGWKLLLETILSRRFNNFSSLNLITEKTLKSVQVSSSASPVHPTTFGGSNPELIRERLRLKASKMAFKKGNPIAGVKLGFPALVSMVNRKLFGKTQNLSQTGDRAAIEASGDRNTENNVVLIDRIETLIKNKQNVDLSEIKQVRDYFKLRWSWLALKHGKVAEAVKIALPALFSLNAWKLFVQALLKDKQEKNKSLVQKIVLIDY
jgi:GT2 family glycosyltransferase